MMAVAVAQADKKKLLGFVGNWTEVVALRRRLFTCK